MDTKQNTSTNTSDEKPSVMYVCPIQNTLTILDGKWRVMIIHALLTNKVLRFGELRSRLPGVTQKMLTAQLRDLEHRGVINRKVYPVVPPKVEYSLTSTGVSLKPIFEAMQEWSIAHDPKS